MASSWLATRERLLQALLGAGTDRQLDHLQDGGEDPGTGRRPRIQQHLVHLVSAAGADNHQLLEVDLVRLSYRRPEAATLGLLCTHRDQVFA